MAAEYRALAAAHSSKFLVLNSPTVSQLGDLSGPADTMNFNYEKASFSRQEDAGGNVSYGASFRGIAKGASVSQYPVYTNVLMSLKTSSVMNAGNTFYRSVASAGSAAYQGAIAAIQSQINYLKAEVAKLTASRTK